MSLILEYSYSPRMISRFIEKIMSIFLGTIPYLKRGFFGES